MDSAWTPGAGKSKQRAAPKESLDDLLEGVLNDDNSPPKKKTNTGSAGNAGKPQFVTKKQSSKDEDFYSSLAMAAEDEELSEVSEADVNQMAKSIADLDDLDADLFQAASNNTKVSKKSSVKDKSGKPNTPRRSGTPRSRSGTPRASSPPLRMTSPGNRVISPNQQRVASPPTRGTPTGRDTPGSQTGIDANRPGSGSKQSPSRKPISPSTDGAPEYRLTTAPAKMTDLNERPSVGLKPGQEQERPKTVPKAKTVNFGDFDEDDPLAGIPLSDEDEDLGLPSKRAEPRQSTKRQSTETSPRSASSSAIETKQESPQQRSLLDRPPTRSGSTKIETPEKDAEPIQKPLVPKPALVKKKPEDALFSDDDDFLGGLGIEEKSAASVMKAKGPEIDAEESRPAKSVMDKLLGKETISKHLEGPKERKEFVLDAKYTQSQSQGQNKEAEDDYMFGSYMPSAVTSNNSRPTSRRSVRFQDDDDIFGLSDEPKRAQLVPTKIGEDIDWLETATGGQLADKPDAKTLEKPTGKTLEHKSEPKPELKPSSAPAKSEPIKPSTAPTKSEPKLELKPLTAPAKSNKAADWLGLKDDDEEEFDFLKHTSFSAHGRQGQPQMKSQAYTEKPSQPQQKLTSLSSKTDLIKADTGTIKESQAVQTAPKSLQSNGKRDNEGLVEENDTTRQMREPMFESAGRRMQMNVSPRPKSAPKSPEKTSFEVRAKPLIEHLQQVNNTETQIENAKQDTVTQYTTQSTYPSETAEDELNLSTDFFSFKKKATEPVNDQTSLQPSTLTNFQNQLGNGIISNQSLSWAQQQVPPQMSASMQPSLYPDMFGGSLLPSVQQLQQQQMKRQQLLKQLQREQQQQFQRQQIQLQKLQQLQQPSDAMQFQLFNDDFGLGFGGPVDLDAQSKIRRLEVELQYAKDILISTKSRYEDEIAAIENSYKSRLQLVEETHSKRESRLQGENEQLMSQQLSKVQQMEEEKSQLLSNMFKKLEEVEREKSQEIERLKEIQRQALENIKKDHEEALLRLKYSKDQQIEAASASYDTSRSLVAAVELIRTNAKDLSELQYKINNWHAQGLDDREITLRAKDEQLKMLHERLNKQQEDNDQERQKLQELVARLEAQIREQTRMLEEERWKVKQEHARLQGLQTALEDERRAWSDHQARERMNMEKSREALLEEQKSTLTQLHKERQALAEEQIEFSMKQKLARDEGGQYAVKTSQAKAELEALTRAIAEARDRYESVKEDNHKEQDHIQEERRRMEKERTKMEKKEAELMEAANMIQEKSREIEETYVEGQRKYEEGTAALSEAQRIEADDSKRIDTINHQLNLLKMKEKEMTEERLRLSKEMREVEKFRNAMVCPNCRHPSLHAGQQANINSQLDASHGLLIPVNGYQSNSYPGNGYILQNGAIPHQLNPALQLTLNTVDAVTDSIKSDRSIRFWKMEAMKDQKYLEEQSLFLNTLKYMPYTAPKS